MRRIVYILLTSVLLTSAFVCLKFFSFNHYMKKANFGMRAICNQEDIEDLYIGSSLFRQGIDASRIAPHNYLLSYNGNMPCLEAMQLKHLFDNGAKFKRLFVDMYPYMMTRNINVSDVGLIRDGDMDFTLDLFSIMHSEGEPISTLYDMVVLKNNEFFVTLPLSLYIRNSRSKNGSGLGIRHGNRSSVNHWLDNDVREMTELQINSVKQIIKLCRQHHVEPIFLETPKYYKVHDDSTYSALLMEYSILLSSEGVKMVMCDYSSNKIINEINGSMIVSYPFDNKEKIFFIDSYHLSFEGREELTKRLQQVNNNL